MFLLDDQKTVVTSASDLTTASKCEFAFVTMLDAKLGKFTLEKVDPDSMLKRAGEMGTEHELRHLQRYRDRYGAGVIEVAEPAHRGNRDELRAAAAATTQAFATNPDVVFQATFFDETDPARPFVGFADFIERQPDGRYRVQDTKLARSPKVTALLQIAAYHEQLTRLGIPADDTVELILGTADVMSADITDANAAAAGISRHHIDDLLPVYRARREHLLGLVRSRLDDPTSIEWGDDRYSVDGRCDICAPEAAAARDVLLVAGMKLTQRAKLRAAGILTIEQLAEHPERPPGCDIPERTYANLHTHAELQLEADPNADKHSPPPFRMVAPEVIGDLPAPDAGDIFFDFEGDPLYREEGEASPFWGLDYLFGLVDNQEQFTAFWAHSIEEEKAALEQFLDWLTERRAQYPNMHVYHYASYERTHLLSLAARHGVGEHIVDDLLRDGVLVDLYPVVKKSIRIGGPSYSIKKLEPLYMGSRLRAEDGVQDGAASVQQYDNARTALLAGNAAEHDRLIEEIRDYNEYDCVSTLHLRQWLYTQAALAGVQPGSVPDDTLPVAPFEASPLSTELLQWADAAGGPNERAAYELASAAVDYHRRENKSFWWAHYARLDYPIDEWQNERGVFLVESGEVVSSWVQARTRSRRTLRLRGAWAPGSNPESREAFTIYEAPGPYRDFKIRADLRLPVFASDVAVDPSDPSAVLVTEYCPIAEPPWDRLPFAITPGPPPKADSLVTAIGRVGTRLCSIAPEWPRAAIADILLRRPSRTGRGHLEPRSNADDTVRAVTASVLDLQDSYLGVQGPPGTGKTYVGSRVIRELVEKHHWRIGVVGQSHKVVENVLRAVADAGLPGSQIGKALSSDAVAGDYRRMGITELAKDGIAHFAERWATTGYVIGGTAWDLTNIKRVAPGQLDLLVIDEAGQFSLAATIAVSVAARNLLLLGDPQQLPQVTQGTHPAPVDQSALGYIAGDHAVLPEEFGYFLRESRRMHSAVTSPVSRLSYDGELNAHTTTDERMLSGITPGLHVVRVEHVGNNTHSVEESDRIVSIVRDHLGRSWRRTVDGAVVTTPLDENDVIVVTPYNAQVELVRRHLDDAGMTGVRVGTVDKFQGQEAAVAIVSLAASSADDVPRGIGFLTNRNRLNVAISRAQWAAYLVHSPALAEHLPHNAEGVAELSRFLTLLATETP